MTRPQGLNSVTVTQHAAWFFATVNLNASSARLSAMSMSTASSSTICGDLHVGDSPEHAILIDEEDEHYSTGYSEFCDDDTILGAQDTICYSSPTGPSPTGPSLATTLGKRKPEDPGPSYAYKRRASSGSDSAVSSTEPYIIVSLDQTR